MSLINTNLMCTVKEKVLPMKYLRFISIVGIILIIGLNVAPAHGAAQTETQTLTIPIEDATMSGNCPGHEIVEHVNGNLKIVTHTTTDANGGFHSKVQVNNVNLKGVGQDSGDAYTIRSTTSIVDNVNSEDGAPVHDSVTASVEITDGDSEKGKLVIQFTINANGEVTVDKIKFTTVCD